MPRQRDLDDEDGTIVTASAPTPPALLHRRPRTDQRLPSAAPQAPTLTEMVFRSSERALQRGLRQPRKPSLCVPKWLGSAKRPLKSVRSWALDSATTACNTPECLV